MTISVEIDMTQTNRGLALAMEWSRRAPEKVIDQTAFHVVKRTIELTKVATPAQIDVELGTAVTLQPKGRGKGFKRAARTRIYEGGRAISLTRGSRSFSVPLAAAIVQASVIRPDIGPTPTAKAYNQRTNFRFARIASPFLGVPRAAGRAAMRAAVHRLIAARRSASGFLNLGWHRVRYLLGMKVAGGTSSGFTKNEFGAVRRSQSDGFYSLEIASLIGMNPGTRGNNSTNYNLALWRYSAPALQKALDEEGQAKIAIYAARAAEQELVKPWNAIR